MRTQRNGMNVPLAPPQWREPGTDGKVVRLHICTITPMFGGGYQASTLDDVCVIRPAAIRGHLRFWWRATLGGSYRTPDSLFEAEAGLWGSASKPGKVGIVVDGVRARTKQCAVYEIGRKGVKSVPAFCHNWRRYALQAFQGETEKDERGYAVVKTQPSTAAVDVEFDLTITGIPEAHEAGVNRALLAWITYGGVGARTRRGCGSLKSEDIAGSGPDGIAAGNREDNHLLTLLSGSHIVTGQHFSDPLLAWSKAVDIYQTFRQGQGVARERGSDGPGKSLWPEPDSIRRLQGTSSPGHAPRHPVKCGFPRADLGLPITFTFRIKDLGDPNGATLDGPSDRLKRFASPVITKAIAVPDGYAPVVLVLNSPHVWCHGPLRLNGRQLSQAEIELSAAERRATAPLHGHSAREALLLYVEREWRTTREVLR